MLAHLHPTRGGAAHELAGDARGIGDAVLAADHRREHVVATKDGPFVRRDPLDRHAQLSLRGHPLLERGNAALGRREEEIADRLEERRTELPEQADARPRELHLGLGRELLTHAPHRLAGGAAGDLAHIREHDALRPREREVVRDRCADRARAGYDDASQARISSRSSSVSCRSGGRTSSPIGTPRSLRTCLKAA